jgi:hypothetical protein
MHGTWLGHMKPPQLKQHKLNDISTSIHPSIHLPVYLSNLSNPSNLSNLIYLPTYPSIHPSFHPPTHSSIHPPIHPSIYIYVYPSIYIYLCLSTYLHVFTRQRGRYWLGYTTDYWRIVVRFLLRRVHIVSGAHEPSIQCAPDALSPGVKLTRHLHLVSRLRACRSIPPLFIAWRERTSHLPITHLLPIMSQACMYKIQECPSTKDIYCALPVITRTWLLITFQGHIWKSVKISVGNSDMLGFEISLPSTVQSIRKGKVWDTDASSVLLTPRRQ